MLPCHEVLSFWFGQWPFDEEKSQGQKSMWFQGSDELDTTIKNRFSTYVHQALNEQFPLDTLDDQLAYIILLDQFTRNIFRGQAKAFSGDQLALKICLELIKNKQHVALPLLVSVFACMPLQHSESLQVQQQSVDIYQELITVHGEDATGFYEFAKKHKVIIDQFQRYPHRNEVMGRTSTEAELEYLENGAERFGQ